jgi:hypothetical protein
MAVAVVVTSVEESADEEACESLPSLRTACPTYTSRPIAVPCSAELLTRNRLAVHGRYISPRLYLPLVSSKIVNQPFPVAHACKTPLRTRSRPGGSMRACVIGSRVPGHQC